MYVMPSVATECTTGACQIECIFWRKSSNARLSFDVTQTSFDEYFCCLVFLQHGVF